MRQIITFFEKKKIWLARITVFGIIVICQLFSLYQFYKTFTSHDKKNNQSPHWPTSLHTNRPISFVYTWKTQLTEFHYNFNTYKNSNMICMPISFLQIFLTRKFLPSLTQDCYNTEWVFFISFPFVPWANMSPTHIKSRVMANNQSTDNNSLMNSFFKYFFPVSFFTHWAIISLYRSYNNGWAPLIGPITIG